MTIFYSAKTNGFYDSQIHERMPSDAVEITDLQYNDLMVAQENGKRIEPNAEGFPVAVNPPGPTPDEVAAENKRTASNLLYETDFYTKESIADSTKSNPYLTNQTAFLEYQNQLRVIALTPPTTPVQVWPTKPKAVWFK